MNYGKPVSFGSVLIEGYFPKSETTHIKGIVYKAIPHKTNGYRAVVIKKDNSKTYMDKSFNPYKLDVFLLDNQYISLPNSVMRTTMKKLFEAIDPQKPTNLITKTRTKGEFILLDKELNIKFVNDTELIAMAIVQVLYTLRCLLFHGELDPTNINLPVYEYAFSILKPIIKELK